MAEGYQRGDWIKWGIYHKGNDLLIGSISLWEFSYDRKKADIGYLLDYHYWGKGYVSEAWAVVKNFAQDTLKLEKIEAWTNVKNVRSVRLLDRQGFLQDRLVNGEENGEGYDMYVYNLNLRG